MCHVSFSQTMWWDFLLLLFITFWVQGSLWALRPSYCLSLTVSWLQHPVQKSTLLRFFLCPNILSVFMKETSTQSSKPCYMSTILVTKTLCSYIYIKCHTMISCPFLLIVSFYKVIPDQFNTQCATLWAMYFNLYFCMKDQQQDNSCTMLWYSFPYSAHKCSSKSFISLMWILFLYFLMLFNV